MNDFVSIICINNFCKNIAHFNNCSDYKILDLIKHTFTILFQNGLQSTAFEKMVLQVLIYI